MAKGAKKLTPVLEGANDPLSLIDSASNAIKDLVTAVDQSVTPIDTHIKGALYQLKLVNKDLELFLEKGDKAAE